MADLPRETTRLCILGDTAGGGPFPDKCINRIIHLPLPTIGVLGNWEAAALALREGPPSANPATQRAIQWTAENLSPDHWAYLERLPRFAPIPHITGGALIFHATPQDILTGITSQEEAAALAESHPQKWLIGGHVHRTQIYRVGTQHIATVGSVGLSADGIGGIATYALLNPATRALSIRHITYDVEAAIADFHASPYGRFIEPYIARAYTATLRTGENHLAKFFRHMHENANKLHQTTPEKLTPDQWEAIANAF